MNFLKLMLLELKITYRSKLSILTFILLTLYVFYLFYSFNMTEDFLQPGSSLTFSSFYVQMSALVFLICGMNTVTSNPFQYQQLVTRIHFHILCIITINFFYYGCYALLLAKLDITGKSILTESLTYIAIYWTLTPLTMYFIGITLSLLIGSNLKYLIGVFICLCLGPFGALLIDNDFLNKLNLAQRYNESFYHPMYGYFIEKYEVSKRVIFIFSMLLITSIFIRYKYMMKLFSRKFIFFLFSVIFIISSNSYILVNYSNEPLLEPNFKRNNSLDHELNYYSKIKKEVNKKQENINSLKYTISFSTDKGYLDSKVKLKFKTRKQTTLKLNLYHGFIIDDLQLNGIPTEYSRQGDIIKIDQKVSTRETNTLSIQYHGNPSPMYYSNSKSIYLPSIFAWIPSFNLSPPITIYNNEFLSNYSQNSIKADYKMHYKGNLSLLTNLESKKGINNTYTCTKCNGLTIASENNMKVIRINNYTIYSPEIWSNSKGFYEFISNLNKITETVNQVKGTKKKLPKKIFLAVSPVYSSLYEQNFWILNDHMILNFPIQSHIDRYIQENDLFFIQSLTGALTWKSLNNVYTEKELDYLLFFDAYLGHYLLSIENDYYQFISLNLKQKYQNDNEVKSAINSIDQTIEDREKKEELLKKWYQLISKHNFDWEELEKLGGI